MSTGFSVTTLAEIPPVPEPEPDDPEWKPVRHFLGLRSFGANAFVAADRGRRLVSEHDELETGHEELYVVLEGRASFTIAGERFDCPAVSFVAIRDPAVVRHAVAADDGTTVLALAGSPGKAYEISRWDAKWTTGLPRV